MSRQRPSQAARCSSSRAPRLVNGTPSASYSSRCQLTVGCTTRRPSESRSRVPSSRARRSGCRSGAITAQAASRSRVVAAAIADSEHERARPRHRWILVARERVVARVAHDPVRPGARPEDDVLADHDGVEPGILCDDGHLDERAQIARRRQRPVLGEDEDELRGGHRGTPATRAAAASTAACWCGSISWPGTRDRYSNGSSMPAERRESASITARPQKGTWPAE